MNAQAVSKRVIIIVGAIAVALHIAVLFCLVPALSAHLAPDYNQDRYTDGYDLLATNLVEGHGYRFYPDTAPTMMREPGYPFFLAGIRLAFGNSFLVVKLFNVLLTFATAGLILQMQRQAMSMSGVPQQVSLSFFAPALLFLFYPSVLVAESRGGIEIIFTFLACLFLVSVLKSLNTYRWRDFIVSGMALGIAVLFRSTPILFPAVLFVYVVLFGRRRLPIISIAGRFTVMVVAMVMMLSPWIIRNFLLARAFVPTASVLGVSAQAGQYIDAHLFEDRPWWLLDREASRERDKIAVQLNYPFKEGQGGYYQTFFRSTDELHFSSYLEARVIEAYRKAPYLLIRNLALNVFNFWCAGKTWAATTANAMLQIPFLFLAVLGAWRGVKAGAARAIFVWIAFVCYVMFVHLPILAQARYSVPLIPYIAILAPMSLLRDGRNKKTKPTRTSAVADCADEDLDQAQLQPVERIEAESVTAMLTQDASHSSVVDRTHAILIQLRQRIAHKNTVPKDIYLSIVIPAYDEEDRLPRTVLDTIEWGAKQSFEFEVILVDDGSRDHTLELARLFEHDDTRIRAMSCPHSGKGAAVRAGVMDARGQYVLFMDADGATPLSETTKLISALSCGYDVAIGSRTAQKSGAITVKTSIHRRVIGRAFAFLVNCLAVPGISDTQCGFKMFRREAASCIFARQKLVGFAFDVEILYIARRLSYTTAEIPVNWVSQPGTKVNLIADSIRMFREICTIRWIHRGLDSRSSADSCLKTGQSLGKTSELL
jgi:dolichyl-phosphate beta-glucosyltransferase